MSGRHGFQELAEGFTPERRRRVDAKKAELAAEMPLRELRRAMALTQQDLADRLQVNQPAVAKLEQRTDMYISSLRSYIESIGGQLRVKGGGDVLILGQGSRHAWRYRYDGWQPVDLTTSGGLYQ